MAVRSYNWLILIALCVTIIGVTRFFSEHGYSQPDIAQKALPRFSFHGTDGASYDSQNFKDRKVVFHFWATWCAPCVKELPGLITWANRHPEITLVTFSADIDPQIAESFLKSLPVTSGKNVIHVWDDKRTISQTQFGVTAYPETFLYKQGEQSGHIQGTADWQYFSSF